jgi:hypothetical protein
MRVAVIVVTMLVAVAPSEASQSCMSQSEARQRFGAVHIYWHGPDHCWDATAGRHQVRRRTLVREVQRETDPPKPDRPGIEQPKWRDSMSAMLTDEALVQSFRARQDQHDGNGDGNGDAAAGTPWRDRWVDIEQSPVVARWVEIAQVDPPPAVDSRPAPLITLRSVVLVLFAFALTLATIEVLFRGTIDERPRSRGETEPET